MKKKRNLEYQLSKDKIIKLNYLFHTEDNGSKLHVCTPYTSESYFVTGEHSEITFAFVISPLHTTEEEAG